MTAQQHFLAASKTCIMVSHLSTVMCKKKLTALKWQPALI